MNSYLQTMLDLGREVMDIQAAGRVDKKFEFAEGWRRHLHLGYSSQQVDPLREVLCDLSRLASAQNLDSTNLRPCSPIVRRNSGLEIRVRSDSNH